MERMHAAGTSFVTPTLPSIGAPSDLCASRGGRWDAALSKCLDMPLRNEALPTFQWTPTTIALTTVGAAAVVGVLFYLLKRS
jgi:hypothetical protein